MIERDRTAIRRGDYSRPVRVALKDGIIGPQAEFYDYGCGHGDDVRRLQENGIAAFGWDPAHRPEGPRRPAAVVNLGYVVNVVEDPVERNAVLKSAWEFTLGVLIVSARLKSESDSERFNEFQDGYLTRLRTFQKFYEQQDLRDWIAAILGEAPVAAAPGVFYLFRDADAREQFVASRYRHRIAAPRVRLSDRLFEEHSEPLHALMEFVTERGRLPDADELWCGRDIARVFGSMPKAFLVVRRVTGSEQWEAIYEERRTDLLVYVALGRFPRRPMFSSLPIPLQRDIKALFSSYKNACASGDALLFAAGKMQQINDACLKAVFGKLMPTALYVHTACLGRLPPLLRVYEGCARVLAGVVEGTTIVKLRRNEPKVSYLSYPEFDQHPHPILKSTVRVDLGSLHLKYRDYREYEDPPILHRKELFVTDDYPGRPVFAALTQEEESAGLFEHPETIGTRERWLSLLRARGMRLEGHALLSS